MQIKLFTIPIGDSGGALQEMNAFLRGNKILEVEHKLIGNDNGAYWCFCVRYIERAYPEADKEAKKVDYRKVLDEATFEKFSKRRKGSERLTNPRLQPEGIRRQYSTRGFSPTGMRTGLKSRRVGGDAHVSAG